MITIATPIYGEVSEAPSPIETGGQIFDSPIQSITSPTINAGDLLWIFSAGIDPDVDGTWLKPAIMNFNVSYRVHCKVADGDATDNANTSGINNTRLFHMFFRCTKPVAAGSWGTLPAASSTAQSGNLTDFPIESLGQLGQTGDRVVTVGFGWRGVNNGSGPSFSYPTYVPGDFDGYLLDAIQQSTTWYYISTFARAVDGLAPTTSADAWGGASDTLTGATHSRLHHFRYNVV